MFMKFKHIVLAASAVLAASGAYAVDAAAAKALASKSACLACHAADKKLVGPAYKDVAAKYKGDKTAAAKLADKIVKGGVGVWGQIPMPANNVTPDEAKALAAWVLSTK